MTIQVLTKQAYLHNIHTRMPFRYGIAEMTAVPHLFLQLECEINGKTCSGFSAESLIPKWFTKDKETSYKDDLEDMFSVIEQACEFAVNQGEVDSFFDLWLDLYRKQKSWATDVGYPSLLWNLGVGLVERAVLDALCCIEGVTLAEAIHANVIGIRLGDVHPELKGQLPSNLLPANSLREINIRHTVGLSDYLTEDAIPDDARIEDGLPQSLESNIQEYGLKYFKIKINGDINRDLARLCQIDEVLRANGIDDYWFTLDGNEQYLNVDDFKDFWEKLTLPDSCSLDLTRLLFVEQPFHREVALTPDTGKDLLAWKNRPLMIIDESDSELTSMRIGLEYGYAGTSHKNCKGIIKSIANACLLSWKKSQGSKRDLILSGEDLANVGPIALLHDLAIMALLGISHVERNGHQYFAGLSEFHNSIQNKIHNFYPELYSNSGNFAALVIAEGRIDLTNVNKLAFGGAGLIEPARWFQRKEFWKFESLEI
jgi:hypothetical protein